MTIPLTPTLIAEQLAICDAASPGPWKENVLGPSQDGPSIDYTIDSNGVPNLAQLKGSFKSYDNASFIVSSRAHYRDALEMAAREYERAERQKELRNKTEEVSYKAHARAKGLEAENANLREALIKAQATSSQLSDENIRLLEKSRELLEDNHGLRRHIELDREHAPRLSADNYRMRMYVAIRNGEIIKLREALRFYGDKDNYLKMDPNLDVPIELDLGERARKALGE